MSNDRIINQWQRHVEKLRQNLENSRKSESRPLRLSMESEDATRFVTVTDGDGIVFAGLRIRIHGMDAPEIDQTCLDEKGRPWPCGRQAWKALRRLLACRHLDVEVLGVDRYGRLLARVLADGRDVAAAMVAEGWAVARDRDAYGALEQEAARLRKGIWRGAFEDPGSWRRQQTKTSEPPAPSTGRAAHASRSARTPAVPGRMKTPPGKTASLPPFRQQRNEAPLSRIERMLADVEKDLQALLARLTRRHGETR